MRLVATCWAAEPSALCERVAAAAAQLRSASGDGHLVEARFDLLTRPPEASEVEAACAAAAGRLLATCRPGGSGAPVREPDRRALLVGALRAGGAAVDIEHREGELRSARAELGLPADGGLVVLSHHEPVAARPPSARSVQELAGRMAARIPDFVKLAAPAGSAPRAFAWMTGGNAAVPPTVGWAPIPLGAGGRGLRLLAGRRPRAESRELAALLYAWWEQPLPGAAALGQPSLADVLRRYRCDELDSGTDIVGVLGWPLLATWSPLLHSSLLRRRRRGGLCVALPCADPAEGLALLQSLGAVGAAVTMPHKEAFAGLAARRSAAVREAGSVNSLRRGPGWEAESFDGRAASAALLAVRELVGCEVAVVGAGGAARALVPELLRAGARPTLIGRNRDRVAGVARELGCPASSWSEYVGGTSPDVIVNATPVGSVPDTSATPLPTAELGQALVFDMVTTPPCTALLRAASDAGLPTVDGLSMFARQAAAQQRWWFGKEAAPSDDEVERSLRELVASSEAGE